MPVGARWSRSRARAATSTSPPAMPARIAILGILRQRFDPRLGRAGAERPGLANLFEALVALDGISEENPDPRRDHRRGARQQLPDLPDGARAVLRPARQLRRRRVADLRRAGRRLHRRRHRAAHPALLAASRFRARFEDKGRIRPMMAAIPTSVITRARCRPFPEPSASSSRAEGRSWSARSGERAPHDDPGSELFRRSPRRTAGCLYSARCPGWHPSQPGSTYAHPRNAFWRIMGQLFGAGPSLPYEERTACLPPAGVALWDVLQTCVRPGQPG